MTIDDLTNAMVIFIEISSNLTVLNKRNNFNKKQTLPLSSPLVTANILCTELLHPPLLGGLSVPAELGGAGLQYLHPQVLPVMVWPAEVLADDELLLLPTDLVQQLLK